MTACPRRAAVAAVLGLMVTGLPVAAEADTSPTNPLSEIATCSTSTTGTTTSPTGTTTSTTGTTTSSGTSAGTGTTPTTGTAPPTTTPTSTTPPATTTAASTPTPGPCVEVNGNVYIIYVITITTTTTTTAINAPILAANGAITWITGVPISAMGPVASAPSASAGAGATGSGAKTSAAVWAKCAALSRSTPSKAVQVTCPVLPAGASPTKTKAGPRYKLICEPAPTKASKVKQKKPAGKTHKAGKAGKARRPPLKRFVVYCKSA